jgi:aurora kinase B
MRLVAYSGQVTGTRTPSESPFAPQSQSGLNTLSQRVLRKEPATTSALALVNRFNSQSTGTLDDGKREVGGEAGNVKGWTQHNSLSLAAPGQKLAENKSQGSTASQGSQNK